MEQGWIPVAERLPEEPKENPIFEGKRIELYLVTVRGADYPFRAFWNGKFFTDGWSKADVTAWMPLPEPYREGTPKQTNADRIRSMTDEELAKYLPMVSDFICQPTEECIKNTIIHRGECEKTEKCAMKWLRAESEG